MTLSKAIAVYPGTFDPITNGHLDILERALDIFQKVIVTIAPNVRKNPLFTAAERMQFILNSAGAVPGPFDAWLVLRGTKTLHLRMPRHDENGRKIAAWLAEKLGHENVIYPGLPSHPQHELAKRQMKGFGGMISVLTGSKDKAAKGPQRKPEDPSAPDVEPPASK